MRLELHLKDRDSSGYFCGRKGDLSHRSVQVHVAHCTGQMGGDNGIMVQGPQGRGWGSHLGKGEVRTFAKI